MTDIPETIASQRYAEIQTLYADLDRAQDIRRELGDVRAKLSDLRAALPIWKMHEEELEMKLESALCRLGREENSSGLSQA